LKNIKLFENLFENFRKVKVQYNGEEVNPCSQLEKQWRMPPVISEMISNIFYNLNFVSMTKSPKAGDPFKNPDFQAKHQLIWIDTPHASENKIYTEKEGSKGSFFNSSEANLIIKLVNRLKVNDQLKTQNYKDIIFLTPYAAQKEELGVKKITFSISFSFNKNFNKIFMRFNYFSCMTSTNKDIMTRFDEKLENLKEEIKHPAPGANCAILTFTNILDVLGKEELKSHYFTNLAAPFPLFGGYKSEEGWKGPCGAVSGSLAGLGIILGGDKKISETSEVRKAQMNAGRFAEQFSKKFGSICCADICGYDLTKTENAMEYMKNNTWQNKCMHFVLFAIDQVKKQTEKELIKNWE